PAAGGRPAVHGGGLRRRPVRRPGRVPRLLQQPDRAGHRRGDHAWHAPGGGCRCGGQLRHQPAPGIVAARSRSRAGGMESPRARATGQAQRRGACVPGARRRRGRRGGKPPGACRGRAGDRRRRPDPLVDALRIRLGPHLCGAIHRHDRRGRRVRGRAAAAHRRARRRCRHPGFRIRRRRVARRYPAPCGRRRRPGHHRSGCLRRHAGGGRSTRIARGVRMTLPATPTPDFADPAFLRAHIADIMAFSHPRAVHPAGGFFHSFRDDGSVYDAGHRHLVSSTRFVYGYAMAALEFDGRADAYHDAVEHGLRFLRNSHRAADGGYAWTLRDGRAEDETRHAYGTAFVLLAYASARKAGHGTLAWIDETWDLLETRFWDPAAGLYRDEADRDWNFSGYRGQNANMHMCEAMIAAFEATAQPRFLARALSLAEHMTRRQAALAGGLVWEH